MYITTTVSAGGLYTWLNSYLYSSELAASLRKAIGMLSFSEEFRIDEVKRALYNQEGYFLSVQISDVKTDNQEGLKNILEKMEGIYSSIIKEHMTTKETVTLFLSARSDFFPRDTRLRIEKKMVRVRGEALPERRCMN